MTSTLISRASALILLIGGIALLFAPDVLLPRLISGFPAEASWLGQLLAAAWLGVAALDWLNRSTVLGGIYGRPIILTNLALYFISALVLLKAAARPDAPTALWLLAIPMVAFTLAYGLLLFRGPLARDLTTQSAA